MLLDPIISKFYIFCKFVKGMARSKRRADIHNKSKEKMMKEFDVIKMIKKIRLANDLWTNILSKDQLKLMKF